MPDKSLISMPDIIVTQLLEKISGAIPVAGPIMAALFGSVTLILERSKKLKDDREEFFRLAIHAGELALAIHEATDEHWDYLDHPFTGCLKELDGLLHDIAQWYTKVANVSLAERSRSKLKHSTKLAKFTSRMENLHRIFTYIAMTCVNITATRIKRITEATLEETRNLSFEFRIAYDQLRLMEMDDDRLNLITWLSPPDPSTNHYEARRKREPKTGSWFVDGFDYLRWREEPRSFIWLRGIPGCGKTVLCSATIEQTKAYCEADPSSALAYFYFDFNDAQKQKAESLLRSLVVQFSSYDTKPPKELFLLYAQSRMGECQPTSEDLSKVLLANFRRFSHAFIIIDALDECTDLVHLLDMIEEMAGWKVDNLHILCTSREERDIKERLSPHVSKIINIQSTLVDQDIRMHVHEIIRSDRKLKRWSEELKVEIEDSLTAGAQGMFRWVACQLDVIRKCLTPSAVRKALKSLPKSLYETYDRILASIDEEYRQYAFRALQWITFSSRPLTLEEITDALAINLEDTPCFQEQERISDPQDIRSICVSLIVVTEEESVDWYLSVVVKLAHYSVKEYLISRPPFQVHASLPLPFAQRIAEDFICQSCLVYLLHFGTPCFWESRRLEEFPLAVYAARFWTHHIQREGGVMMEASYHLMMQLLGSPAFVNFGRIIGSSERGSPPVPYDIVSPLYYASCEGLVEAISPILLWHDELGFDINQREGFHGTALGAASFYGHEMIVEMLLDRGADVNVQAGTFGTALGAASYQGSEKIVEILLDHDADLNVQRGIYGTALGAASYQGSEKVVKILLAHGADVNLQGGHYGTALGAASYQGSDKVVQILLAHGADVNLKGGHYQTALGAAQFRLHEKVVEILLDHGAHFNMEVAT